MNKNKITQAASTRRESPFAQCIEKDEYFTGFGHLNVFASIRRDVDATVPIIVLTGEGGCGKSVLGKMLMSETISGCISVYFRKTIDSFEDVVGDIASRVGVVVPDATRAGIALAIERIAAAVAQREERFLLICDGAEQIYLATLERIRRMLDRINRADVLMQVILIGRPILLDNLKQLRLCNFEEVAEKKYVLEPLSLAETTSYLEFSKKRMSEEDARLFTPKVVDYIYRASAGNIKKINCLAEEIFGKKGKESSFWQLLENVEGEGATTSGWSRYKGRLALFVRKKPSLRAGLIGAAIVSLGLMLFVFREGEETQSLPAKTAVVETEAETVQNAAEKTESAAPAAARNELSQHSVKEGMSTVMEPSGSAEQQVTEAQPPGKTATAPLGEVGAASSEPLSVSTEEQIAGDGGSLSPELAEMTEDRQKAESLLAEAQEAVNAARQDTGEMAVSSGDEYVPAQAGGGRAGKGLAAVNSEESVKPGSVAEKTGDFTEISAPAPLVVLRPIKFKKVVITKLQAVQPGSQQVNSRTSASVAVAESGKVPRLHGEEGKKKVFPQSAAPVAANQAEQGPFRQIPRQSDRDGGLIVETSERRKPGIPGSPDKIAQVQSESKKIPVLGQAIVPRKESAGKKTVDHTGNPARVDADPSWLAGAHDSKYTLQLMALSSAAAVENVHKIVAGNAAARDADTFYVFEKNGNPSEIFVFIGEYDSAAEAGKARDSLPEPLRKHKPYVLSVKSAMQKVK